MAQRNWRITARDRDILEWVVRWRAVTSPQITRELSRRSDEAVPLKSVERRMRALRDLGLVQSAAIIADTPMVHWATNEGMLAGGMDAAGLPPRMSTVLHDLEVVELSFYLLERQPTHRLVTEREIRLAEGGPVGNGNEGPEYLYTTELLATPGRKFPDVVTISPTGIVVQHELERTAKERTRLIKLMTPVVNHDEIRACIYWTYPHLLAQVEAAAAEANLRGRWLWSDSEHDKIIVREWNPARPRAVWDA